MLLMSRWRSNNQIAFRLTKSLFTTPNAGFATRGIGTATRWRMSTTHEELTIADLRQARLHDVYLDRITPINEAVRLIRLTTADDQSLRQDSVNALLSRSISN